MYNNASEVARDALRRMEEDEQRALRVGNLTLADVLTDFTAIEEAAIWKRVLEGMADIKRGDYTDYEGREGLERLFDDIVGQGRERFKKSC